MKGALVLASALSVIGCRSYPLASTPGVSGSDQVQDGLSLGSIRLKPQVCTGVSLEPETRVLSADVVLKMLRAQGLEVQTKAERTDLEYLDVVLGPKRTVRLRVAVLTSPMRAGEDLHQAMALQGTGSWGVRRGNIAILGPVGHVGDILAFAAKTGLACWGMLSIQSGDDTYVVPGGYLEF
jgi:hypothetical protein